MAPVEIPVPAAPASSPKRPHAVCIPYPAQGHINPMLKLAKLLHQSGFHITFVNSEYNHRRLLKSSGPNSLDGLPSFRFRNIPDGLPPTDADATQDIPSLCESTTNKCLPYFRELISELNCDGPPVTCIVSDGVMSFTMDAAEELGVPEVLLWTTSACGFMGYVQFRRLIEEGYTPLRDVSYLTNGYLDTVIDWIPGMKNIRLRDLPSFLRTTDPNEFMLGYAMKECERARRASAIILNTFESLEHDVLDALRSIYPCPVYPIGPLQLLLDNQVHNPELKSIGSNLWKEDTSCLDWLDTHEPNSVIYVNFGSITVMTNQQLVEFAWGLANSEYPFLWIIRPDLVIGDSAVLPAEFMEKTKGRGMLAGWCPQEKVLSHPSIGGFLTHSGWNSTLESLCAGVAMVSWPFFAEQQMNCRYCCMEWGIGMEIDSDVRREVVERQVRELMAGEAGMAMREKTVEWRRAAEAAAACGSGTSCSNLEEVVNNVLLPGRKN